MKTWQQNAALLLASCIIAIVGIEIGLRIWGPDVLALGNQYIFYQFDPVLGWVNLPGAHGQFSRLEYTYPVEINALGMRDLPVGPKQPGTVRVAFLGDSFTWGVGAAYGERFTEVVERLDPKIDALNFGVSGYAPVQYLLQLDSVLALRPDAVVLVLCLGNDLTDNVESNPYGHAKPYARLTADGESFDIAGYPLPNDTAIGQELVAADSPSRIVGLIRLWLDGMRQAAAEVTPTDGRILYAPPEKLSADERRSAETMFAVNAMLLNEIDRRVRMALGPGRFAVLLAPTKYEYGLAPQQRPDADAGAVADRVLAALTRDNIPAIDGRDVIRPDDFWRRDGHWRPSGHAKIGEMLAKFLPQLLASP
jgi:lysophospholipase L1-like esterase